MGDDHCTAGEFQQRIFQGCEGLNVQVVSGLIEQQQVTALLEGQRQVQTVTLTTGEHTRLLLLIRALEAERGNVRTRRHFNVANLDVVQTVRDDLPEALLRVDVRAVLVNVRDLHGLADLQLAAVQGLQANDGLEQGGLTHTVRTDHTNNAVTGQGEGQTVNQGAAVEALLQVLSLNNDVTQAGSRRNLNLFEVKLAGLLSLRSHLLVACQTSLRLSLAALSVGADPVQFLAQALSELSVLLALNFEAGTLLLQVGGVVTLVGVQVTAVNLGDPLCHVVEEVTVVGNRDDGTLVGLQVLLQPEHGLCVQVVGGLVEQQQVRLLQQQLAQCHAAALTTGEVGDGHVSGRATQRFHCLLQLGVEVPCVSGVDSFLQLTHFFHEGVEVSVGLSHEGGDFVEAVQLGLDFAHAFFNVAQNGLLFVQRRLLHEDTHGVACGQACFTVGGLVEASHDLQDGRLTRTVRANHTDLGAGEERHRHVVKDDLVAHSLAGLDHLINKFSHSYLF